MHKWFLLAALVGVFLLAGCGSGKGQVVSLDASWAGYYPNLHSLKAASDLIVRGRIAGIAGVTVDDHHIPYTDFNVTVAKVLACRAGCAPSTILLHQTGADQDGTVSQVDGDPLFQVGEQVVLFLHQYSPGHYFVLGGPQGRFEVGSDGMVRPVNDQGTKLAPMPETQFDNAVASA